MRRFSALWAPSIMILYPFAVWLGHGKVEARYFAGLLLLAGFMRLPLMKAGAAGTGCLAGALLLSLITFCANHILALKLYPVLVNGAMLAVFTYSLFIPPSIVEQFARSREPNFGPQSVRYTRRVTQVWCAFFAFNGAVALFTALWTSAATWSLYNGVIAYLLMGVLFAAEYGTRRNFKRRLECLKC